MQVPDYRARYFRGDWFDYQQTYFEHLAQAAETGLYDTLAHPDLVKNEAPLHWKLSRIEPYIQRALDRKRHTGAHLPVVGGASGMGILPMSDGLTQTHGRDARATAELQMPPTTGRCARHTGPMADALASLG